MKNLLKAELFVLIKQKSKLLLLPLLMLAYFIGIIFVNDAHNTYINNLQKTSVGIRQRASRQMRSDNCVLGPNLDPFSDELCGLQYFSEKEIAFAKKRLSYNQDFFYKLVSMNAHLDNKNNQRYFENRLEMLKSAKIMQEAGIVNAYYESMGLILFEDRIVVDMEIAMLEQILTNDYQLQMSPYAVNSSNYLRVFLANGGLIVLIMIIVLFNIDVFINEDSRTVNNVLYTQSYSRFKINLAKIIASMLYSLATLILSLLLCHLIIGIMFGFGSIDYPLLIRSNINSFNYQALNTYVISSVKKQLAYISLTTTLLTITMLLILHVITVLLQNSSTGLFLVYILLTLKFILKDTVKNIFMYYPFAYDNMQAVFNENYNFRYGMLTLLAVAALSLSMTLYIGNHIDIKAGD